MYHNEKGYRCIEAKNEDLINDYLQYKNIYEVAKKHNCSPVTVFNRARKAGLNTSRKKIKY